MAKTLCFCGCGRKMGFGSRGINKNGQATHDRIESLRSLLDLYVYAREISDDRGDVENVESSAEVLADLEDLRTTGEEYEAIWTDAAHGIFTGTRNSATLKAEWKDWLSATTMWEPYYSNPEGLRRRLDHYKKTGELPDA